MTALLDVLKDSAIAILSGGSGVGAAVWKLSSYLHAIQERIKVLEEKVDTHLKTSEASDKELKALLEEVNTKCGKCKAAFDQKFDGNRAEHIRFVSLAAFNSFVKEQNESWQDINRLLGRIEGELTARRGSWTNET